MDLPSGTNQVRFADSSRNERGIGFPGPTVSRNPVGSAGLAVDRPPGAPYEPSRKSTPVTSNRAPPSAAAAASICQPCSLAICLAIARP